MKEHDKLVGARIGSFLVQQCLGTSEAGVTYAAEHPDIQHRVVIRVLLPRALANATAVRRFMDEARAVNRVKHPAIVRISDCGSQGNVGLYLVMERIEGPSVAELLAGEKRLPPLQVARVLRLSASALGATHEAGIIHRNLRPSCIFFVEDPDVPGGWRVRIAGFGLAKLLEEGGPGAEATGTGTMLGSSVYASPEQCLDPRDVDGRTDIFALGAIAYHLLCGRPPFEASSFGHLVLAHQNQTPVPLRTLDPQVPEALAQIVQQAIQRDREQRQQSMTALGRQIDEALGTPQVQPERKTAEGALPRKQAATPRPAADRSPRAAPLAIDGVKIPEGEETLLLDRPVRSHEDRERPGLQHQATDVLEGGIEALAAGTAWVSAAGPGGGETVSTPGGEIPLRQGHTDILEGGVEALLGGELPELLPAADNADLTVPEGGRPLPQPGEVSVDDLALPEGEETIILGRTDRGVDPDNEPDR